MLLSIIIKALNEEAHIERAVRSALGAVAEVGGDGEVILADSASSDQTVSLAQRYSIRIVQLSNPQDRSCGVGAQLGFAVASGEYVYILDGDMELLPGFMPAAIQAMANDSLLGGVGGLIEEMVIANHAFALRAAKGDTSIPIRSAICLNMGGLYRRSAINDVGYLTNRNLHAFEEFELGVRLTKAGWRLERMDIAAVQHFGPSASSLTLLLRRWNTRYACGHGELFRAVLFKPHGWLALSSLRVYRVQLASLMLWLICLTTGASLDLPLTGYVGFTLAAWLLVFVVLALDKRSFGQAAYSIVAWHVGILGFFRGAATRPAHSPAEAIDHRVIQ